MSNANETKELAAIVPRDGPADAPSSTDPKVDMIANAHDIGAIVYAEAQHLESDDLEGERGRVKRKLDRILMPMVSRIHSLLWIHIMGLIQYAEAD